MRSKVCCNMEVECSKNSMRRHIICNDDTTLLADSEAKLQRLLTTLPHSYSRGWGRIYPLPIPQPTRRLRRLAPIL